MSSASRKITGILLAGGQSSRMGYEKGKILLGDKLLYQYPLKVLESLCDEIIISSCKKNYFTENYKQLCDEIPDLGPMGGLYTCLKKSSTDLNFVLSYDLPLMKKELFLELMKYTDKFDIILPEMAAGNAEPLCGIYKKSVYNTFQNLIKSGNYSVHTALQKVKSKTVLINDNMPFYQPDLFMNINKESDLEYFTSMQ